jgi:protein-S-isoprenylcysteine O-methyltransferase Ste14
MTKFLAVISIILLIGMVIIRVRMMTKNGTRVLIFGKLDKKDFLIPPFALFYFYLIFANAFPLPTISREVLFESEATKWAGVGFCFLGIAFLLLSLIAFKNSFRVGIDLETKDELITTGVCAISRNPIYTSFAFVLIGQFLVFPNWIVGLFLVAGVLLFNRQVLLEEKGASGNRVE